MKFDIETIKEQMAPELERIQMEMYRLGKKDCLKTLSECFNRYDDDLFSKVFVLSIIDTAMVAIENKVNE